MTVNAYPARADTNGFAVGGLIASGCWVNVAYFAPGDCINEVHELPLRHRP